MGATTRGVGVASTSGARRWVGIRARSVRAPPNRPRGSPRRAGRASCSAEGGAAVTTTASSASSSFDEAALEEEEAFFSGAGNVAHLTAKAEVSAEVTVDQGDVGEQEALQSYLQLPIEQYFIIDPNQITQVGPNDFVFSLPKLHFFNVWVAPEVSMAVDVRKDPTTVVTIKANRCVVKGSPFVQRMKLNDKLMLRVETSISEAVEGKMVARSDLNIWCEVVRPFHLVPRGVLEKTCSGVIQTTLNALLKAFLFELKRDYDRWATDPAYREERASRSM